MTSRILAHLLAAGAAALMALPAGAEPVLRQSVAVDSAIVTAGDLFDNAGNHAERPMFRAPRPGTVGAVSLEAVRTATERIGIPSFTNPGVTRVRVERTGVPVTTDMLEQLISADLERRGIVSDDVVVQTRFDTSVALPTAAAQGEPVRLASLRYTPGSDSFMARFEIAGLTAPLDIRGRLDLMIEAPHLAESLPGGTRLSQDDIEMRPVELRYAENGGMPMLEELIGKELKRSARRGMLVRAGDVTEPELIERNAMVTLSYSKGRMNLTVKGRALNAAAKGEAVSVLNLVSKQVVHGVAADTGKVAIPSTPSRTDVAQKQDNRP